VSSARPSCRCATPCRGDATRKKDLAGIARRVAAILDPDECLLIGGLAVGAHGYVRATDDVDFVTRLTLPAVRERFRAHGIAATIVRGDVLESDPPCVKALVDGVRVDVLARIVPLDWDRSKELVFEDRKARLRVVDLEGLVRLKLRAGGPQDLMDTAALVILHPGLLEKAREIALAYSVDLADKLNVWLADRRLQAQVDASRRSPAGEPRRASGRRRPRGALKGRAR
jgi:hypothetical protein